MLYISYIPFIQLNMKPMRKFNKKHQNRDDYGMKPHWCIDT